MKIANRASTNRKLSVVTDDSLPDHVFEMVVAALTDALVLDYQKDGEIMVNSPRGKEHEPGDAPT